MVEARYPFKPVRVEHAPVPEHPYQVGLRGEPCVPPEGLSGRVDADWRRKWRNGAKQRKRARKGRR